MIQWLVRCLLLLAVLLKTVRASVPEMRQSSELESDSTDDEDDYENDHTATELAIIIVCALLAVFLTLFCGFFLYVLSNECCMPRHEAVYRREPPYRPRRIRPLPPDDSVTYTDSELKSYSVSRPRKGTLRPPSRGRPDHHCDGPRGGSPRRRSKDPPQESDPHRKFSLRKSGPSKNTPGHTSKNFQSLHSQDDGSSASGLENSFSKSRLSAINSRISSLNDSSTGSHLVGSFAEKSFCSEVSGKVCAPPNVKETLEMSSSLSSNNQATASDLFTGQLPPPPPQHWMATSTQVTQHQPGLTAGLNLEQTEEESSSRTQ